jgi:hypothetical protein
MNLPKSSINLPLFEPDPVNMTAFSCLVMGSMHNQTTLKELYGICGHAGWKTFNVWIKLLGLQQMQLNGSKYSGSCDVILPFQLKQNV